MYLQLAGLLLLYFVLDIWIRGVAELPRASFEEPVLFFEGMKNLVAAPTSLRSAAKPIVLLFLLGTSIRFRSRLFATWAEVSNPATESGDSQPNRPRLFPAHALVLVLAVLLTWVYTTYDFDFYYNQARTLDRWVLFGLFSLVVLRPAFVLPFTLLVVSSIWQFKDPIGLYSTAEAYNLVRILTLFTASFVFWLWTGKSWSRPFLFLVLTLVTAAYLRCGIGKALLSWQSHGLMNWAGHGHIYNLLPATYSNGWLGFLEPATIGRIARNMARFDLVIVGSTILLEIVALFAFVRRKVMLGFLIGWAVFHLAIFATSGICFWKWIILDLTLFLLFWRAHSSQLPEFNRASFLISIPLILGGMYWFQPVNLAWFDSPLAYTYRFEAIDDSGRRIALPPEFFSPYDYAFTIGSFHYLVEEPNLHITWGATWDRDAVSELAEAESQTEALAIEAKRGSIPFRAEKASRLDGFVQRFVYNYNYHRHHDSWPGNRLKPWKAPRQLWTFPRATTVNPNGLIEKIVVSQVSTFFDGQDYEEIRVRELRTIVIPGTSHD